MQWEYNSDFEYVEFSELVGLTLKSIELINGEDGFIFEAEGGRTFRMVYHDDCCASCSVEEVHGDLKDLLGSPILMAEESSSTQPDERLAAERQAEEGRKKAEDGEDYYYSGPESETWTFYKISTIKGSVTIRWYGSSNGYYSESASFEEKSREKEED